MLTVKQQRQRDVTRGGVGSVCFCLGLLSSYESRGCQAVLRSPWHQVGSFASATPGPFVPASRSGCCRSTTALLKSVSTMHPHAGVVVLLACLLSAAAAATPCPSKLHPQAVTGSVMLQDDKLMYSPGAVSGEAAAGHVFQVVLMTYAWRCLAHTSTAPVSPPAREGRQLVSLQLVNSF